MKWITKVEISNGNDILVVGNEATELHELESLQVDLKEKSSTFSFEIRSFSDNLINRFPPKKTMVKIYQGPENDVHHLITGFITSPPVRYSKKVYQYSFEGCDFTTKLQDILVNEAYENKRIDYIVNDLLEKYFQGYEKNIEPCDITISIKFKNKYLYDCMEQLANVAGWNFKVDKNLVFQFWNPRTKINPNTLNIKNCKPTFDFRQDITNLVTRLRVEGATRFSDDQITIFQGNGENKIFQIPGRNIRVSSNGDIQLFKNNQPVNLGIKNIHTYSENVRFLYDASNYTIECAEPLLENEKLKVIYRYEYPIFYVLENLSAIQEYGIIDRTYKPNSTDEQAIKEEANNYLAKYSKPIYAGSIEPFFGFYEPGELVRIQLPKLKLDDYLKITSVQYSGTTMQNIKLNIEETMTDADLLKSLIQRIRELEEKNKQDGPVVTLINSNDEMHIIDDIKQYKKIFDRTNTIKTTSLNKKQYNIYEVSDFEDSTAIYSQKLPQLNTFWLGGFEKKSQNERRNEYLEIVDQQKLYNKNFDRTNTIQTQTQTDNIKITDVIQYIDVISIYDHKFERTKPQQIINKSTNETIYFYNYQNYFLKIYARCGAYRTSEVSYV